MRCGAARRSLIGPPLAAVPAPMRSEADELQGYEGYDVFGHDPRTPDFTNCTSHPARVHLHRQCHTKSIVRPALVELQHAHQARSPCCAAVAASGIGLAGPIEVHGRRWGDPLVELQHAHQARAHTVQLLQGKSWFGRPY